MGSTKTTFWTVVLCVVFMVNFAQAEDCYTPGSLAGAIIGTFLVTLCLVALVYLFYRYYWKNKRDKSLVLANDPENVKDEFAFDNPGFKPNEGGHLPTGAIPRPTGWPKHNAFGSDKAPQNTEGRTFLDDTFPEHNRTSTMVPLWSKDFTGLGFEVAGSMRDGIYVSRVLRGGPAYECGKIHTGDRINSVRISFRNMVYEDALAILSFASPYELQLEVQPPSHGQTNAKDVQTRLAALLAGNSNVQRSPGSTLQVGDKMKKMSGYDSLDKNWKSGSEEIKHPVIKVKRSRCNSYGDMNTLEKTQKQHHFLRAPGSPNSTLDSSNQSKNTSLKKILADKIITNSTTLEKNKSHYQQAPREQKHNQTTTLERENEKNAKNKLSTDLLMKVDMRNKTPDGDMVSKPERTKNKNPNEMHVGNMRTSSPPDVVIIKDGGDMYSVKNEKVETQKRESDPGKKGMKFGIRVLPPNIPDDGTLSHGIKSPKYDNVKFGGNENGSIVAEIRSIDEVDKNFNLNDPIPSKNTSEDVQKPKVAPVVAKRREKPVAPIPNARITSQNSSTIQMDQKFESPEKHFPISHDSTIEFNRNDDLNSSGIKRDAQGIPQEIPQHMMEAAMYARNNRKSTADSMSMNDANLKYDSKKSDIQNKSEKDKNSKKSKGKAPSPPEANSSRSNDTDGSSDTDVTNSTQETVVNISNKKDRLPNKDMNFTDNFVDQNSTNGYMLHSFIENEKNHSNIQQEANRSDDMILSKGLLNTSTPKVEKIVKRKRPDIPVQKMDESLSDNIDDIVGYTSKEVSDSLNNFFEDSKSNVSSTLDINSEISFNQDSFSSNQNSDVEKVGHSPTTIALNSSDITIHSSPVNDPDNQNQELDENERKACSLGDLSRLEKTEKTLSNIKKPSQGTLERAQSLDISSEDSKSVVNENNVTPKKRKSNSVFDTKYYDDISDDVPINSNESVDQILVHSKEPRLSLNISNISMEGLNTFQKNRLKKATEWGNLEDAIISKRSITGSSHSGSSEIGGSIEKINDATITNGKFASNVLEEENKKLNEEINKFKHVSNEIVNDASDLVSKAKEIPSSVVMESYENDVNKKSDTFKNDNISLFNSISVETQSNQRKPDISVRNKQTIDSTSNMKPNFEIGTYKSDTSGAKYKTESTTIITSGKLSPKLEEKLTMIYDTNIPDDIKVSRHTLVSSLERPKSDLMKKLLAQNQVLTNLESPTSKTAEDTMIDPEIGEQNSSIHFQGINHNITNLASGDGDKNIDNKSNLTTFTMLNQPDIVNLKIKQKSSIDVSSQNENLHPESDFVSNINIGTLPKNESSKINFNLDGSFGSPEKLQARNFFSTNENVVTITTDGSQPSSIITIESDPSGQNVVESFRNSIEINSDLEKPANDNVKSAQSEPSLYNEIISELQKSKHNVQENNHALSTISSSSKTYLVDGGMTERITSTAPFVIEKECTMLPTQKTVTVSVTEDEHGNKIVTQNVEEARNRLVTITTTTPIEIEQYTFGVIKNPTEADFKRIEDMENDMNIDKRLISDIEKQSHMKLIPSDTSYTNTETMMVNANMSEEETNALLSRFRENPHMMMSGNKISQHPEMIIKETKMIVEESDKTFDGTPLIKMTQASYKYNIEDNMTKPTVKIVKMIESGDDVHQGTQPEIVRKVVEQFNKSNEPHTTEYLGESRLKDYITEIEVKTPRIERIDNQNDSRENIYYDDTEVDISFMNDFLSNERRFSAKERTDSEGFDRRKSEDLNALRDNQENRRPSAEDQSSKRHSDFDLPRNTHIKFRTATYEPQNPTPNRLSLTSEKRLSQIEILKSNFEKGSAENLSVTSPSNKPAVLTKPSNIPIKLPEKPALPSKTSAISPSKIPVLNSQNQKSASQENLLDKNITFQKTSPHAKLSPSLGNISITSIKSSSRNPSGK
ncbi:uncharacterized protein LOC143909504 [Arctopsyche grandis]|uniref:uncharacterized protein LOC143909504 n=1 Tax=Arctopsyche grandis TaxID=121162 RepID=UPI00406D70EB